MYALGTMEKGWGRWVTRAALAGLALATQPAGAIEGNAPAAPRLAVGVTGHDQGPFSDHNEHGVDLNLELQSAPLDWPGSPRAHVGATLNFNGYTNTAYAGLNFPFLAASRWFLEGMIGVAVHDGPLHKDPASCETRSDCGFGTRFLPRVGIEIGYRIDARSAVSLFFDHMSHKWVIEGENEGLDQTGLRYLRSF